MSSINLRYQISYAVIYTCIYSLILNHIWIYLDFSPLSDRYRNISIICSSLVPVLKIYQSPLLIWNITHSSIVAVHGVIMYIVLDFTDDLSSSSSTLTQLLTKNNFCMDVTSPGMCVKVILKVNLWHNYSEHTCNIACFYREVLYSPNLEIVI